MEMASTEVANMANISKGLSDMLDDFTARLAELAEAADDIFELISIEMLEDGADTETLDAIAGAVSTAISGFEIERRDDDGKIC